MHVHVFKHVKNPWFTYIKEGEKTGLEFLCRGKALKIEKGDHIKLEHRNEHVIVKVLGIYKHKDLENLFDRHSLKRTLPGVKSKKNGIDIYEKIFGKDKIREHGLIEVKVKLLK